MAKTITFTASADGSYDFIVDADGLLHGIEDADTLDQLSATKLRIVGHNGTYEIDTTADTVILDKTALGGSSTTYAPGSAIATVFRALKAVFTKRNTSSAGTGTSTQTTSYQEATATAGQTVFPFTLPSTKTDFMVFTNGGYALPSFYSHTTTALTLTTGADVGDIISVHQIK